MRLKAQKDIEANYYKIVFEKNEVAAVRANRTDTLHRIAESVGVENIIFEIGPGIDAFELAYWLIKEFGFEVNLGDFNAGGATVIKAIRWYELSRVVEYNYFNRYGRYSP